LNGLDDLTSADCTTALNPNPWYYLGLFYFLKKNVDESGWKSSRGSFHEISEYYTNFDSTLTIAEK
jgi:hypothetical protein